LLYPAEDARPLSEFQRDDEVPLMLIVPDATWSQAARMRKRVPGLATVPCAHLPIDLVSEYRLRHDPRPAHLSTLQAIAVALGILEGPAIEAALLQVQRVMVDRTLWTKGRLAPGLVEGGLPATAATAPSARGSALVAPSDD
jgi:DTW domain-containing protein YfiP